MKSAFFVFGFLVFLLPPCLGQDAVTEARKRLTERRNTGNTGAFVTPTQSRNQTVVSYVTYLSEEREWIDAKGRKMTGRLVAFSAPEPGKTGPVVVLHEGKVRLRRSGAKVNSDLPLDLLSEADRDFVKSIDAAIKRQVETAAKAE
ncbi:MAG: hypothetical protein P1V20_23110 [Verrucomicrobiales bacterium]|nr:hypothetical protein [Verrucomicrobiales bacterium]